MSKWVALQVSLPIILFSLIAHSRSFSASGSTSSEESSYILKPYLGYEQGYLTQNGVPEIKTAGSGFGAQIGGRWMGLGFGFDYFSGLESAEQSGQKSDFSPTEYGFFLNYQLFSNFNMHGTYLLNTNAKIQSDENLKNFSGTGYKVGIAWHFLPWMDINLDLYNRSYNKYDDIRISNPILSSAMALSLSIPIL